MTLAFTTIQPQQRVSERSPAIPAIPTMPRPGRVNRRAAASITRATVIIAGIGLAIVVPLGWGHWIAGLTNQATDDAYLRADTTPISAEVAGRVRDVLVADYQHVKAGDVIARLDDRDYAAQYARSNAQVAVARASIGTLESQIALQAKVVTQAEASVMAVAADRDRASGEDQRQQSLARNGWSTTQRLEVAAADIKRLDAQLAEKRTEVEVQRQRIDVLRSQKIQAEADLSAQQANLELASINLDRTAITAPIDGVVSVSNVRPGQFLAAGSRVISVVPLPNVYVLANYKETQLAKVRVGQPTSIKIDSFPGRTLLGHVSRISPASGSEFALLPPDNATGNFTKVAQRVTVRIEIDDPGDLKNLLRPGMSVVPTIHTDAVDSTKL
jgi:membrane fusion protein (multidrug efflux system)